MRESYTAVIERNVTWQGDFASEPYECAWSGEAIFFVRTLSAEGNDAPATARVQLSPDGIRWVDEGTSLSISAEPGLSFCRVTHYGGWLRIAGAIPPGQSVRMILYLCLKE